MVKTSPILFFPASSPIASPTTYWRERSDIYRGRRSAAYAPAEGCLCCLQILCGVLLAALLGTAIAVPLVISLQSASTDTTLTSTTVWTSSSTIQASSSTIQPSSTTIPASSSTIQSSSTTIQASSSTIQPSSTTVPASSTSISPSTTSTLASTTTTNICTNGSKQATQLLSLNWNSTLPWTYYSFNYTTANVTSATLTFAFRNDPAYWYLDDVYVINSTGTQLLLNKGFEMGYLSSWVYCNPYGANFSGLVTSSVSYSGQYSYQDGSVGWSDYLSQTFAVKPLSIYSISFWLGSTGNYSQFAVVTISA